MNLSYLDKLSLNYKGIFCFLIVTIVYIISRWLTFKGFNGSDDLHYAMLSSGLLKKEYNPFNVNDIFSGRILLISWQAIIYSIFGINIFSTQVGTLAITVVCCYLTIFKLAKFKDNNSVLFSASLFYFNPVLTEVTVGILPDVYIMLTCIIILILWMKILQEKNRAQLIIKSLLCGIIAFLALFFKETAIIFAPFFLIFPLFIQSKKNIFAGIISLITLMTLIVFSGLIYYYFTGDFFFRLHQIVNSGYINDCSYNLFSLKEKVARLTYKVWEDFIVESFYPVILAVLILLIRKFFYRDYKFSQHVIAVSFLILFSLGLYFPFSYQDYQPLCAKARHFIYLLAPGVIICTSFFKETLETRKLLWLFILSSILILIVCIFNSGEKWYWLIYGLLGACFIILKLFGFNFLTKIRTIILSCILWLYMPYHLLFIKSDWFKNMNIISLILDANNYYYFPDHDNMTNWELLHGFTKDIHCLSLEKNPFKIFKFYYTDFDKDNFKPGWLIINNAYTNASAGFLRNVQLLGKNKYFTKQICAGDVCAFFIDNPDQLIKIKELNK